MRHARGSVTRRSAAPGLPFSAEAGCWHSSQLQLAICRLGNGRQLDPGQLTALLRKGGRELPSGAMMSVCWGRKKMKVRNCVSQGTTGIKRMGVAHKPFTLAPKWPVSSLLGRS